MSTYLWPTFTARDSKALISFLVEAFGFRELVVYEQDGRLTHAELAGPQGGGVMLGAERPGDDRGIAPGVSCYVVVDDVDALFARASAAGAEVISAPFDTDYGSRDCSFKDPEGNSWFFGTYAGHEGS
jgi:uncharacterized glyoxalase superfamily protein PhnB